jgi:hypothetical protein
MILWTGGTLTFEDSASLIQINNVLIQVIYDTEEQHKEPLVDYTLLVFACFTSNLV